MDYEILQAIMGTWYVTHIFEPFSVWLVGFMAALSQIAGSKRTSSCWDKLALASTSGFVGFAVVSVFAKYHYGLSDNLSYYWGLSALVALGGKLHEFLVAKLIEKVFGIKFNVNIYEAPSANKDLSDSTQKPAVGDSGADSSDTNI